MNTPCRHTAEVRQFQRAESAADADFEVKLALFRTAPLDCLLDNMDAISKADLVTYVAELMMPEYDREAASNIAGCGQHASKALWQWFDDTVWEVGE